MAASALSALHALADVEVREHEPMASHTSFAIGGPADILALPRTLEGLRQLLVTAGEHRLPLCVIGNGSNLLVRDGGVRGLVIKIADNLATIRQEGCRLVAQSGASLARLCVIAAEAGLAGLSFAAGIPGTLGGAVWMNAGANDGCIGNLVHLVRAFDLHGAEHHLTPDDLDFGYRHSSLQGRDLVVAEVTLDLCQGEASELHTELCDAVEKRCGKQPLNLPSAGSIFKRPPNDYAGRLIESVGGKGLRVGGAEVSAKHAGFIVNTGGATAADVLALIHLLQERVQASHGIVLEPEVRVLGED